MHLHLKKIIINFFNFNLFNLCADILKKRMIELPDTLMNQNNSNSGMDITVAPQTLQVNKEMVNKLKRGIMRIQD